MGHQRRSALITVADKFLLCSESNRIAAWTRNDAKCHNRTHASAQAISEKGTVRPVLWLSSQPHKGIKAQFPHGIVSSVSFVSTTNTARSLAGFVLLALALTPWRSPGSSEKLCPAL